ncbi:MAG: glycosyltransferase [Erysipelothrix sp.]|nr:glycosyltransferase [Erysipelothrix sp.]
MNFSIVIPTWNRSSHVNALLKSLYEERNQYQSGVIEVIVIDSSVETEKDKILKSCLDYDARYLEGDHSVRKKRNRGIVEAQFNHIIFIDSDVVVVPGYLDEYVQAYQTCNSIRLGGILGLTEFEGHKSFWWKILESTSLIHSFSFAKEYPFHSWTIGNNVSFKKSVLEEVGMFEENFPFKLGGDDLDLTYRITKAGYMIGSAPNAITKHSRDTWSSFGAIFDRAMRWGTMERFISNRHPELLKRVIPKNYLIILLTLFFSGFVSVISQNFTPIIVSSVWTLWEILFGYLRYVKKHGYLNPIYYYLGQFVQGMYEYYRIKQSLKEGSYSAFTSGLVFSRFQIRYGLKNDSDRIFALLLSYSAILIVVEIIIMIMGRVTA